MHATKRRRPLRRRSRSANEERKALQQQLKVLAARQLQWHNPKTGLRECRPKLGQCRPGQGDATLGSHSFSSGY